MSDAEKKGLNLGWADAERLVKGTRAERKAIRRRWAKARDLGGDFWRAYYTMFDARAEAFLAAIREGRLPRTISPTTLGYIINNG